MSSCYSKTDTPADGPKPLTPECTTHVMLGLRADESSSKPAAVIAPNLGVQIATDYSIGELDQEQNAELRFGSWLADPSGMLHVAGSYDTYKCTDCNITLSGYKMGDRELNKHVFRNAAMGSRCRYIKATFKDRQAELEVLEGLLRFQQGQVAWPSHTLFATGGYVMLSRDSHCVFCSRKKDEGHYRACCDMLSPLKQFLINATLNPRPKSDLLFRNDVAHGALGSGLGGIWECDGSAVRHEDFSVLGEKANMVYVGGTRDKHHCYTCGLTLKDFVVGDTLLGEHIYHVYNKGMACRYIERKYSKGEILYILGKERYRRGQMAFPSLIDKAEFGYSSVEGLYRCILCSATIFQGACLPPPGHDPGCYTMAKALMRTLTRLAFLNV